jgi:hypothetical protein
MPVSLENKDIKILLSYIARNAIYKTGEENRVLNKMERGMKRIKTSSAKAKGRDLQQWVCRAIADMIQIPYNQQNDQCEIHSREMGQAGIDIILRGEAIRKFPYSVECKNSEGINVKEALHQAQTNCYPNTSAIVVHKQKGLKEPIVIMEWSVFEALFRQIKFYKGLGQ